MIRFVVRRKVGCSTREVSLEPRLQDGAVYEDEADNENCQRRNWPEHGASIGPNALERNPCTEEWHPGHLPESSRRQFTVDVR